MSPPPVGPRYAPGAPGDEQPYEAGHERQAVRIRVRGRTPTRSQAHAPEHAARAVDTREDRREGGDLRGVLFLAGRQSAAPRPAHPSARRSPGGRKMRTKYRSREDLP
ncbi:hypothetical protein GCM10010326_17520 [Streptomyces xanthochromogenes]|uniref:Uncharacterized protein n=1 Tax=Streptomyces xanthochromogenes TaxID=67384 RepID=A0ABQ2ZV36_9ACTN|nr:hypothetical protein GCM10010326_17520 [Streptomyces xanthochromogenes]